MGEAWIVQVVGHESERYVRGVFGSKGAAKAWGKREYGARYRVHPASHEKRALLRAEARGDWSISLWELVGHTLGDAAPHDAARC